MLPVEMNTKRSAFLFRKSRPRLSRAPLNSELYIFLMEDYCCMKPSQIFSAFEAGPLHFVGPPMAMASALLATMDELPHGRGRCAFGTLPFQKLSHHERWQSLEPVEKHPIMWLFLATAVPKNDGKYTCLFCLHMKTAYIVHYCTIHHRKITVLVAKISHPKAGRMSFLSHWVRVWTA